MPEYKYGTYFAEMDGMGAPYSTNHYSQLQQMTPAEIERVYRIRSVPQNVGEPPISKTPNKQKLLLLEDI